MNDEEQALRALPAARAAEVVGVAQAREDHAALVALRRHAHSILWSLTALVTAPDVPPRTADSNPAQSGDRAIA